MRNKLAVTLIGSVTLVAVIAIATILLRADSGNRSYVAADPVMRRLTEEQYKNVIADLFGADIEIGGRFEPGLRVEGLLAIGSSHVSISNAGMEQFDLMAYSIASQVVDERHRELTIPCEPLSASEPDDDCARQFFRNTGKYVFRRPLTELQVDSYVRAAHEAATIVGDFYQGISMGLAAMLASPQFLFQIQQTETVPGRPDQVRLDAYSKASQLSFFLWNSMPDAGLFAAAESGDLHSREGLGEQVHRMIASPRLESGFRGFFEDNFRFDEFATLTKDAQLFPKFDARVAEEAREQTLKTLVDLLLERKADYREIFTTKNTFLTPHLGAIYQVPVVPEGPNGSPDSWQPFEFGESDPQGGILTHISFTGLHSPPGRGSPTIRGKAVREVMLCQKIPAPPGDVSFDFFLDSNNEEFKTARQRLAKHDEVPECAGCHRLMDPVGLAFENFDGSGAFRLYENGVLIDASGDIDGVPFEDAVGLGKAIQGDTAAPSCLVNRLASYALGREPVRGEREWIQELATAFATNGYSVPDLMQTIATSEAYYRVADPQKIAVSSSTEAISIARNTEVMSHD